MIDSKTAKILKFISERQSCSFADVENFIGVTYENSPHFQRINRENFIYRTGANTFSLTPEGESALEDFNRLKRAERLSYLVIFLSILALLKPANVGFIESFILSHLLYFFIFHLLSKLFFSLSTWLIKFSIKADFVKPFRLTYSVNFLLSFSGILTETNSFFTVLVVFKKITSISDGLI